ncbi:hypothetical protein I7I50_08721 [Histoplasma capsulatum G186AR]|uniref:Uncharacterized protein n=1 Tax=Ajellomyces capsulatus TaxID=5037 RepID=A0A8H7YUH6_AJECA|nr:hypothetical protein I7I52_06235 [Histoplasma capsulatum]QSS73810.1 hypothetical protein I7I50_08721 [Histoplasma capsulatum G186AR]
MYDYYKLTHPAAIQRFCANGTRLSVHAANNAALIGTWGLGRLWIYTLRRGFSRDVLHNA